MSTLKFRNYRPSDATLTRSAGEVVKPSEAPSLQLDRHLHASSSSSGGGGPAAATAVSVALPDGGEIAIAPRKPNWDLKRDVEKRLAELDAATDRAIKELAMRAVALRQGEASGSGAAAPAAAAAVSSAAAVHSDTGGSDGAAVSDAFVHAVMSAEEIDLEG